MHPKAPSPKLASARGTVPAAVLSLVLILACSPAPAAETRNSVSIGYDSFIDRFSILEEDTVETVHDFYMGLNNSLSLKRRSLKTSLRSLFKYGNQTVDENIDGELFLDALGSTRIDLRSSFHWKHYREGSDYSFGNDFLQSNTLLKLNRKLGGNWRLILRNRFEVVDYEEKTTFDYDYGYLDAGVEIEGGSYLGRLVRFGILAGLKEIPDTTALSYRRAAAELELHMIGRGANSFHLSVSGDRRNYTQDGRSPYWNTVAYADLTFRAAGGKSYSLKAESELTVFDEPSSTFFDIHFLRAGFRARFPVHSKASLFIEPRMSRMFCWDFSEERYLETSIALGFDVMGTERFWLTGHYEPGYRNYNLEENELYSDFYINRLSLMGSASLTSATSLNLFVTHDPERHSRREDDFSITLVSVELANKF